MTSAEVPQIRQEQTEEADAAVSTTASILTPAQSIEFVQTLVHASMSCICYLRHLFSDSCFNERCYSSTNTHWSYGDYISGTYNGKRTKQNGIRRGTTMKFLQRGKKPAADQLLDWLENGAFDALHNNSLRAIQLRIVEDPQQPEDVLETYTFSINYCKGPNRASFPATLEVEGPKGLAFAVVHAQTALQEAIRTLVTYCNTLPSLPEKLYLAMILFYASDVDQRYEAPGFERYDNAKLQFPEDDVWRIKSLNCSSFGTPFHHVDCVISHLDPIPVSSVHDGEYDKIPPGMIAINDRGGMTDVIMHEQEGTPVSDQKKELQVSKIRDNGDDMVVSSDEAQGGSSDVDLDDFVEVETQLSMGSGLISPDQDETLVEPQNPAVEYHTAIPHPESAFATEKTTQLTQDLAVQKALKNMLQPSVPNESEIPTQPRTELLQTSNPETGVSVEVGESNGIQDSQITTEHALQFSQYKIHQLNRRDLNSGRAGNEDLYATSSRSLRTQTIGCQCDWQKEEGQMLYCRYCEKWQHVHCYGYRGADDPRLPSEHICYQCLLGEGEAPLLEEMKNLILLRRAVFLIDQNGYTSNKTLADRLGCDLPSATRLFAHIKNERFVRLSGSDSKHKKYRIVKEGLAFKRLLEQCFDPTLKIVHHLSIPSLAATNESLVCVPDSQAAVLEERGLVPSKEPAERGTEHANVTTPSPGSRKRDRAEVGEPSQSLNKSNKRLRMSKSKDYIDAERFS